MIRSRTLTCIAISAGVLLAAAGCSAESPGPATDPEPEPEPTTIEEEFPEFADDTECVVDREWQLDVPDLTQQLVTQLESTGMNVVAAEGTGQMTIIFSEDTLVTQSGDITFTISVQQPEAPAMQLSQRQHGGAFGSWFWDGGTPNLMVFEDWESTYQVDLTMSIEGTTVDVPIELPDPVGGGSSMTTTCVGDTLATNPEGSPFTQFWTPAG